jgi:cytochrome b561
MPTGYNRLQIALHWMIFVLIVLQFVLHEPIVMAWEAIIEGRDVAPSPLVAQHVFGGLLVLALALLRLFVRLGRGAPALPEKEPAPFRMVAHVTHWSLYGLMILVPLSGAVAWFGGVEAAAEGHEILKSLLLLFVFLHIAGALVQQFVFKTNIMARMKRPG